ncbi:MAG TPA: DUF885 family protein [Thermoanaerobaculia bacterium]|nr:DUF885 family protein [Thermoanaerobaculia bacterium]
MSHRWAALAALCALTAVAAGAVAWWRQHLAAQQRRPAAAEVAPPAERFADYLRAQTGVAVTAELLLPLAEATTAALEERMDAVARQLAPDAADWRPLFALLLRDHPASEAAVLAAYRREVDRAEAFVRERRLVTLPAGGVEVEPLVNPIMRRAFPFAVYLDGGRLAVTLRPAPAAAPVAGYLANHCRVCIPPLAVHETYPGHHVAFAAAPHPRRAGLRRNLVFHEGWALYGELLMLEHGYWQGQPELELAALRMLQLRAVRAAVDAALATGALGTHAAAERYRQGLLLTPQAAASELHEHLRLPGRKATYLVGALQILTLRRQVAAEGGGALAGFHDRLLTAERPLPEVAATLFAVALEPLDQAPPLLPTTPLALRAPLAAAQP